MASFSMARHVDAVVERLMHETPHLQLQALLLLSILALLLLHLATASRSTKQLQEAKRLRRPPSPPGLPVIGHLHLVGALPHVSLRDLAREHGTDGGGLMMLRLGVVPNLVVSSPPAAQAVMRTHDHLFASRPPSGVADLLLYGSSDIAFSTYGEHWRQLRKLVTTHLFTVKKVQSYRLARQQEVRLVIDKIRSAASSGAAAVDMSETMNTYVNDVVCRTVSGKFFRAEGRNKVFRELIQEDSILFSGFNLEDYFPRLAKLRLLNRLVLCKAEKISKRWDELLETIIRDHETKTVHRGRDDDDGGRSDDDEEQESDFIDVLLSVQQEYRITRDHVKAILMDMFAAGTDTSSIVLECAMAELMRKPQLMTKLQDEVRNNTPRRQEMVEEENLASMTYLKAVVKETLRLHPPAPLLLPRLSMADCDVDGHMIPSGTRVIVNAWAIGRDPGSWERPEEFLPERFVVGGGAAVAVDLRGNDFQFVPFGAGRRICPGLNFGLASVEIMLANLAYCFDWELPAGVENEDIDMTEVFGVTVRRKEKLMLVPKCHGIV